MLNGLLLTLNIIVCILLIIVVLMQRSEGGALGQGGSPTGLVTARGAGDLLTRITWILFALFLMLSLAQTVVGGRERSSLGLLKSLKGTSLNLNATTAPTPTTAPGQTPPPNLQVPATNATRPLDLSAPKPTVNLPPAPAPRHSVAPVTAETKTLGRAPAPYLDIPEPKPAEPLDLSPKPTINPPPVARAPEPTKPPTP